VIMEGTPCAVNSDRVESFRAVISKYPNIKVLASDTANWNTEKGLTLMENFLQKFDHIDAVWAGDDDVLVGALKAYTESKRSDIKCFIGGGGSKTIIEKIMQKNPVVPLTVTYPPKMIYEAAKYGLDISKGKSVEKRIVLPAEVINNSNAKAFYVPESSY